MKKKVIFIVIGIIVLVWVGAFVTDNLMVRSFERKPIFCIAMDESKSHFVGAGYSFDAYPHPITGKFEYQMSILGISTKSTFTN